MRILIVSSYYKPAYVYGGPVQSITNLCEGLANAGANVSVFTTNANGSNKLNVPLRQPVNLEGVEVYYFPLDFNGLTFFYSSSLEKKVIEEILNFDIVVAETLWGYPLIPVANACTKHKIPYIVSARGQLNAWALARKNLKKKIYLSLIGRSLINKASAIYCTDQTEVKAVENLNFSTRPFFIPNGIRCRDYLQEANTQQVRAQYGIPSDAVVLIFLGRLTQIKRPDIALDALLAAQHAKKNTHLIYVGPDEENWLAILMEKAKLNNCADKIHFAGLQDKKGVISALAISNLLLMPSEIQENFGNAALEALAAGVPVLCSDGIPMGIWADKVGAGKVVKCDSEAFQRAAFELISDLDRLEKMGKVGAEMVQMKFDVSVVAQQMLRQYETIIATGSPLPDNELF
jgi:glycosyltransferase involved in cell wall biosynthesis